MTSEERVLEFFDVFPAELPELRKSFKRHLDQHAAEATKQTARKCRQIAQQRFLAENQAVSIDEEIALLFEV